MQTGPEFFLSVSSCKGILYLKGLGGVQLKEPPCSNANQQDFTAIAKFTCSHSCNV